MAGSMTPQLMDEDAAGTCRIKATVTCDASGVVTAAELPVEARGRLVGVAIVAGSLDLGNAIFSLTGAVSGAPILTIDSLNLVAAADKFASTTTGDTTGGAAEDLWSTGAVHGLVAGDRVIFTAIAGNGVGGPTVGQQYFVVTGASLTTTTFQLSDTAAHALAGTNIVNVGATDATSSSWFKVGNVRGKMFRPTAVMTDNAGAAVTAATTAPNVNRDIFLVGPVKLAVAEGGNLGSGQLHLIVAPI